MRERIGGETDFEVCFGKIGDQCREDFRGRWQRIFRGNNAVGNEAEAFKDDPRSFHHGARGLRHRDIQMHQQAMRERDREGARHKPRCWYFMGLRGRIAKTRQRRRQLLSLIRW